MIKYFCSDGTRLSQTQINHRRTAAYKTFEHRGFCQGCGGQPQGHAHVVAQSRAKSLKKSELIYDHTNFFEVCHACNSACVAVTSEASRSLLNHNYCLEILRLHDPERYRKAILAQPNE